MCSPLQARWRLVLAIAGKVAGKVAPVVLAIAGKVAGKVAPVVLASPMAAKVALGRSPPMAAFPSLGARHCAGAGRACDALLAHAKAEVEVRS